MWDYEALTCSFSRNVRLKNPTLYLYFRREVTTALRIKRLQPIELIDISTKHAEVRIFRTPLENRKNLRRIRSGAGSLFCSHMSQEHGVNSYGSFYTAIRLPFNLDKFFPSGTMHKYKQYILGKVREIKNNGDSWDLIIKKHEVKDGN